MKWKHIPKIDNTWLTKEKLEQLDPDILERYHNAMASEVTSSQKERVDEDIRSKRCGPLQTYLRRHKRGPPLLCFSKSLDPESIPKHSLEAWDFFSRDFILF